MDELLGYVKIFVAFVVVALIAFFRGKYYGHKPVVVPDNSSQIDQAKEHEALAKKEEEKAKQAQQDGDANAQNAQKLRDEALALEKEAQKKKEELAKLDQVEDKQPQNIEEADDEFKKLGY